MSSVILNHFKIPLSEKITHGTVQEDHGDIHYSFSRRTGTCHYQNMD